MKRPTARPFALVVVTLVGVLSALLVGGAEPAAAADVGTVPSASPGSVIEVSGNADSLLLPAEVDLCWDRRGCSDLGSAEVGLLSTSYSTTVTVPEDTGPGQFQIFACTALSCSSTTLEVVVESTTTTSTTVPTTPTTTTPTPTSTSVATAPSTTTSTVTTSTSLGATTSTTAAVTPTSTSPASVSTPTTLPDPTATTVEEGPTGVHEPPVVDVGGEITQPTGPESNGLRQQGEQMATTSTTTYRQPDVVEPGSPTDEATDDPENEEDVIAAASPADLTPPSTGSSYMTWIAWMLFVAGAVWLLGGVGWLLSRERHSD